MTDQQSDTDRQIQLLEERIQELEVHNAELERLVRMKLQGSRTPKDYTDWQEEARRVLNDSSF